MDIKTVKMEKVARLGECCPVLALALQRDVSREAHRGFEVTTPFDFSSGKALPEVMIYRFPKAASGDKSEFRNTTYAACAYCPFCGTNFVLTKP